MTDTDDPGTHVAIIGMACRFPGADDPDAFWRNLTDGCETITRFPDRTVPGSAETYTPARGLVSAPEKFDAGYFGYSPREARLISPQHRVLLECGVEALESAGYDPARYPGAIGVYAGGTETAYAGLLKANRDRLPSVSDWEILIANGTDFLVPRLSYKLGLRGPAVTVASACATSLVAVHLAVQALLAGECEMALAGGIAVHAPMKESFYTVGGILSADGRCRTFAASAAGTVGSDGAGLVVLKRLSDALDDGDFIHAVIRGTAINNDGSNRIGFTAPSVDGQARVIRDAQVVGGVNAATITYIEAHGTATPLGDPIEVAALVKAFRQDTDATGFCGIGSVKSNIGHTDAAAGAAGLIKTAVALRTGLLPPSLHCDEPNPKIDFASTPFRVVSELQRWQTGGAPRRAGVSAFGIGGTNAHIVLEQPPDRPARGRTGDSAYQLIVVSGRTATALDHAAHRLADHLDAHADLDLADAAWTLQTGRGEHAHRRYIVTDEHAGASAALRIPAPAAVRATRSTALLFGDTTNAPVECSAPAYTEAWRSTLVAAGDWIGIDAANRLLGGSPATTTASGHIITFAAQYALAELWRSWGLPVGAATGVGVGAVTAAAVCGACTVSEAIRLIVARAEEIDGIRTGDAGAGLAAIAAQTHWQAPSAEVFSAATGLSITADPAGWIAALGDPGQLDAALSNLLDAGYGLVEGGSGALLSAATYRPEYVPGHLLAPLLPDGGGDATPVLLIAVGEVWRAGAAVNWDALHEQRPNRVPLPTYPFERERFLIDVDAPAAREPEPGRAVATDIGSTVSAVTDAFAHALDIPEFGTEDSFFDLGGDSLIAVDIICALSDTFGITLAMTAIYDAPTPTALAALIDTALTEADGAEAVAAR